MAIDIKVPSVGESITEGTIARWLKKDGALVRQDEPILELETEKATQEVPAPASGILHTSAKEGQTVAIGAVIGSIETSAAGASPRESVGAKPAPAKTEQPKAEPAKAEPAKAEPAKAEPAKAAPAQTDGKTTAAPLSPAARRLAAEERIEFGGVSGSGRGGLIMKSDVADQIGRAEVPPQARAEASPSPAAAPAPAERETRQPMSAIRQRIADRLVASQKATASLTTFNEADLSVIIDLRNHYKDRFKEKHGVALGFMSFFVKAVVEALRAYPVVNARIDKGEIVLQNYYNIGVAVSTDKGLMVPVLHDAERMSFAEIEKAIAGVAAKARDGKISVGDLQGGTFTITNGGIFGSMMSTPILNPPQSAILGMHAIQKRPVVRDDQIVIRPMMYLALTYDHRLIDGREAVLFLVRVKECVENPAGLLLEV